MHQNSCIGKFSLYRNSYIVYRKNFSDLIVCLLKFHCIKTYRKNFSASKFLQDKFSASISLPGENVLSAVVMLHIGSVHIVSQGYRIIVQHSISRTKQGKVKQLRRGPNHPLGQVQTSELVPELSSQGVWVRTLQYAQCQEAHTDQDRGYEDLIEQQLKMKNETLCNYYVYV